MSKGLKQFIILMIVGSGMLSSPWALQAQKVAANKEVIKQLEKVADWQLQHDKPHEKIYWHYGAFYTGLMAAYEATGNQRYLDEILDLGKKYKWKTRDNVFHADAHTIIQPFTDAFLQVGDSAMIAYTQWVLDMHIARQSKADVRHENNPYKFEWWTWCDALYMSPPAFAKMYVATGDQKYLDYMNEHWWISSDYLYDESEGLFYRDDRFFEAKSKNGEKIFWSRGNGWVIGGLARVLEILPKDYPTRPKFEQQFVQMANSLADLQQKDGLWTTSLLDAEEFPITESSGSAFFCYAMAWGVRNDLLDQEKFIPVIKKAWKGLNKHVSKEGMLGYVQQVGSKPEAISADDWQLYGSGAYLLAAAELLKLQD
ncbi:MAG: glycoside hydrolase family 88 protein [Reichenbachiella sp.]|uniref:glycoside hydrolase family 88/105 protein n=1 Tax=Reichenbachiella sp. TaxID=2184521 RepID=UPI003297F824